MAGSDANTRGSAGPGEARANVGVSPSSWLLGLVAVAITWQTCTSGAPLKWIPSYAGPFVMYMDKVYACRTAGENAFAVSMRPSHFRTPALAQTSLQTLEGNFSWAHAVDDTWAGMVKMDVWSGNQWKENSLLYRIPSAYCSSIRSNFPGLYQTFYDKDPWAKEACVFEAREYYIDNEPINWTVPNFPVMPYGRYRTTSTVWAPRKARTACFVFEMIIVPKL